MVPHHHRRERDYRFNSAKIAVVNQWSILPRIGAQRSGAMTVAHVCGRNNEAASRATHCN